MSLTQACSSLLHCTLQQWLRLKVECHKTQLGKTKLDAVAHCREDSRKTLDIDFSCVHAASKSYCMTEKACSVADSPVFATQQAEGGKLKKYGHLCAVRGHTLLPIVLNTYGGFGDEIMKIINKYFDAKRAEEKAATGQE